MPQCLTLNLLPERQSWANKKNIVKVISSLQSLFNLYRPKVSLWNFFCVCVCVCVCVGDQTQGLVYVTRQGIYCWAVLQVINVFVFLFFHLVKGPFLPEKQNLLWTEFITSVPIQKIWNSLTISLKRQHGLPVMSSWQKNQCYKNCWDTNSVRVIMH
jgi:hypothetical protein